jgi:thiol-disulfide isomerase/thioredoxin
MKFQSVNEIGRRDLIRMAGCAVGVSVLLGCQRMFAAGPHAFNSSLGDEGSMPDFKGATGWLNSTPLGRQSLRGKVVLVNFWTYTCINSLRPMPYVKSWAAQYQNAGLVVIGVHSPEFSFEKETPNVQTAANELNVRFPIAIDSDHKIWDAFDNEYWPAQYLVDAKGRIRYHHFGEGDYAEIEHAIVELLKENGTTGLNEGAVRVSGVGIEAAPDFAELRSPETYIGYRQAQNFASPERTAKNSDRLYSAPARLSLNHWALAGTWNVNAESAVLESLPGSVVFRFHGRDLHLVMAPTREGTPVRFRVKLDGVAAGVNSGVDVSPDGTGLVREPRLYQLVRQKGPIIDRTFEIEFLDPGAQALDFTFG